MRGDGGEDRLQRTARGGGPMPLGRPHVHTVTNERQAVSAQSRGLLLSGAPATASAMRRLPAQTVQLSASSTGSADPAMQGVHTTAAAAAHATTVVAAAGGSRGGVRTCPSLPQPPPQHGVVTSPWPRPGVGGVSSPKLSGLPSPQLSGVASSRVVYEVSHGARAPASSGSPGAASTLVRTRSDGSGVPSPPRGGAYAQSQKGARRPATVRREYSSGGGGLCGVSCLVGLIRSRPSPQRAYFWRTTPCTWASLSRSTRSRTRASSPRRRTATSECMAVSS